MQRASIRKQKLSVHEGVNFICDQCEYEATRRSHLTEHKKAQSDGVTFDIYLYFRVGQSKNYVSRLAYHFHLRNN